MPVKWKAATHLQREYLMDIFSFREDITKCCTTCHKKISKKLDMVNYGLLRSTLAFLLILICYIVNFNKCHNSSNPLSFNNFVIALINFAVLAVQWSACKRDKTVGTDLEDTCHIRRYHIASKYCCQSWHK